VPSTIVDAALFASRLAASHEHGQIPYSTIPLIVHQTAISKNAHTWNPRTLPWVEKWLRLTVSSDNNTPVAYFFWDDAGMHAFINRLESALSSDLSTFFAPIEQVDIFRILLCRWIGGVVCSLMNMSSDQRPRGQMTISDI
jgi:hypothetical protein